MEKREFHGYHDPDRIMTVSDLEFVRCDFYGSGFGYRRSDNFLARSSAKNIRIIGCKVRKCLVGPALLENIHLENLDTDVTIVWGALFKHVTIRGRCDNLMIHGAFQSGMEKAALIDYWGVCDKYYETVDWALDIQEAEFEDFWIRTRGIPSELVRRDTATQAVVKRENAINGKWRDLNLSGLTKVIFSEFLRDGLSSVILVAPKRHKKDFKDVMEDIHRLRDAGIADQD